VNLLRRIWIRIRYSTAEAAVSSLLAQSDERHAEARVEPDAKRRDALRAEADCLAAQSREVRDAIHKGIKVVK
jgi:hypothetical protein